MIEEHSAVVGPESEWLILSLLFYCWFQAFSISFCQNRIKMLIGSFSHSHMMDTGLNHCRVINNWTYFGEDDVHVEFSTFSLCPVFWCERKSYLYLYSSTKCCADILYVLYYGTSLMSTTRLVVLLSQVICYVSSQASANLPLVEFKLCPAAFTVSNTLLGRWRSWLCLFGRGLGSG